MWPPGAGQGRAESLVVYLADVKPAADLENRMECACLGLCGRC